MISEANVRLVPKAAFRLEICRKTLMTNPLKYHFGRFTPRRPHNIIRSRESECIGSERTAVLGLGQRYSLWRSRLRCPLAISTLRISRTDGQQRRGRHSQIPTLPITTTAARARFLRHLRGAQSDIIVCAACGCGARNPGRSTLQLGRCFTSRGRFLPRSFYFPGAGASLLRLSQ